MFFPKCYIYIALGFTFGSWIHFELIFIDGGLPWWLGWQRICLQCGIPGFSPRGRSPGGGHGNPLQYSSLENLHGQRSLAGYSPWSCEESDTTVQLSTPPHMLKTQRPRQSRVLFPSFIWTKLKSLAFKTQNFCCFHHKNTHHFFSLKVFWGVLFWI